MRRLCMGLVVAAATVLVPTWAWAGNQEVAERIAANLRESGQLQGYRIGVKFQDGTAWLKGQVSSPEQKNAALTLVSETPGVTRVVDNLTVSGQPGAEATEAEPAAAAPNSPLSKIQSALTGTLKRFQPAASASPLQQAAGAVAPERLPRSSPDTDMSRGLYADSPTQSAQKLREAGLSQLSGQVPSMPAAAHAERVPTTFAQVPVQPAGAMAVQEPMSAVPQVKRQPIPVAYLQAQAAGQAAGGGAAGQPAPPQPIPAGAPQPIPQYAAPVATGAMPAGRYDQPYLPNYAWPGYAAYPNYAGVTYPRQYSPMAWPYIGPFYPYPQAPLGWRKVTLQWHDGWWFLDFDDGSAHGWFSGLFRHCE
jgi:hypothetical protein